MSSVYRTHTCGQLRPEHVGQQARLSGWVQRKRDHGNLLFIDLRDHYGVTQVVVDVSSPVFKTAEAVRSESVITVTRQGRGARGRDGEPAARHRRSRARRRRDGRAVDGRDPADPGLCRARHHAGGAAAEVPLPRPAQGQAAQEHHAAQPGHRQPAPAHDRAGLHGVPDADPDGRQPRGRALLRRAEPSPSRQVLCPAAGAADVQAAADGVGLRPLLPDRALLPRRGRARRPRAGRVLPARLRDELRHPGRRVRRHRAGAGRRVRGVRRPSTARARARSPSGRSRASPMPRRC